MSLIFQGFIQQYGGILHSFLIRFTLIWSINLKFLWMELWRDQISVNGNRFVSYFCVYTPIFVLDLSPQLIKRKLHLLSIAPMAVARLDPAPPRPEIDALQMSYRTVDGIQTFLWQYITSYKVIKANMKVWPFPTLV